MEQRLDALGVCNDATHPGEAATRLYASYARASGDQRTSSTLEEEGQRRLMALREGGFDVGIADEADADARLERIYEHARRALYATLDDGVVTEACPRSVRVRTAARNRDEYLAHPQLGERLRDDEARVVATLYSERKPQTQFVISDGLNADAVNEQLRMLLPMLRRLLIDSGSPAGAIDIVVQNGRVRVGYEIGGLVGAEVIVHLLGERPGTGLNTLSAYITYGRDEAGSWRWSRALDHSVTTAICGIHAKGKPPHVAAVEIARTVARMLVRRTSGVALKTS
jgi:ethanolamine ammonia-lyase small subunit